MRDVNEYYSWSLTSSSLIILECGIGGLQIGVRALKRVSRMSPQQCAGFARDLRKRESDDQEFQCGVKAGRKTLRFLSAACNLENT
jgi:hypothetical protein